MGDRIQSDHPSVHTVRATLAETTTGLRVEIPASDRDRFPVEDVIRVVIDESETFARTERPLTGETLLIPGLYDSPRYARNPGTGTVTARETRTAGTGETPSTGATSPVDRLAEWAPDHGVPTGGSVLVDVIEPEFLYGLRAPGETVVYDAREPPDEGLQSIAEGLDDPDFR